MNHKKLVKVSLPFLLWLNVAFAQTYDQKRDKGSQSEITDVKGKNVVITVVQSNNHVVSYDLKNREQSQKFLDYLVTVPTISKEIKDLLRYSRNILDIVSRRYDKITDEGVFDPQKFIREIEDYKKRNELLLIENAQLREQTKDLDFSRVLDEANIRLEEFDNEGYENVLENFKRAQRKEISKASYLQSANNFSIYNYPKALLQINEALENEKKNYDYAFLKAQILTGMREYDNSLAILRAIISSTSDYTFLGKVNTSMGRIYEEKGEFDNALEFYGKAKSIYEESKNDTSTAVLLNNIGFIQYEKGNYNKALEYYRQSLVIREKLFGNQHPITAVSYNSIGLVNRAKDDFEMSLEFFGKAKSIYEATLGNDHPYTADSYNNIGSVYEGKGYLDEALFYYNKAVLIREKVFGVEHPITAISYNSIGMVWRQKSNYYKALECCSKGLLIREKVLGVENRSITLSYNNLGLIWMDKGNYEKALDYYGKALTIQERIYGVEHIQTAATYNNMGLAYENKGDVLKALKYYNKSINVYERVLGKENPSVATIYNNICLTYCKKGEYGLALDYCNKSLTIRQKLFGRENLITATSYNNLGLINKKKVDLDKALGYYFIASDINEKVLGMENVNTAISYYNIASLYKDKEDYDKAIEYYIKASNIYEKALGIEHSRTININQMIGILYISYGNQIKGLEYLSKTPFLKLSSYEKFYSLYNHGIIRLKRFKYKESINFFHSALSYVKDSNSFPNGALLIDIYYKLGRAYCYNGQKVKALDFFERALLLSQKSKNGDVSIENMKLDYEKCKSMY